ncbi:hypothetical protein FRZ06_14575 [Anoxybacterium hadale]|uniref:Uncharacterized protein n=1 Tax=Anoxybacterium hadale TaxID=3408580 RepID=A0ACD1ACY0_9FIRM|nr:hypothetical protein FRZ06_14575 [Clostridiales bacterium]
MEGIMKELYDEISELNTVKEYKDRISQYVTKLKQQGLPDIASEINSLSEFYVNKLSKESTFDSMKQSQTSLLNYIENHIYFGEEVATNIGISIVRKIIANFHLFCKSLYKDSIHGKCSAEIKDNLSKIEIKNEYDVQQLMYPLIRAVFPDARLEKNEDSGHHTVREDIVIDSQNIIIELKCSRKTMNERSLSEEVAADIVHYNNKYIVFYIYDKENVIKNPHNFKKTYEGKMVGDKQIYVEILQPTLL